MKHTASLKTQISFLKVPDAIVKIYYKKPDKIKIKNENGISLVPKETVSISLYSLVNSQYTRRWMPEAIKYREFRYGLLNSCRRMKMGNWCWQLFILTSKRLLVLKVKTTTRENGTNK